MKPLTQKQQRWANHISTWQQSNMSQADYCRQHNINQADFYRWKSKLSKLSIDKSFASESESFVSLEVENITPNWVQVKTHDIELHFSTHSDPTLVRSLLNVLGIAV